MALHYPLYDTQFKPPCSNGRITAEVNYGDGKKRKRSGKTWKSRRLGITRRTLHKKLKKYGVMS